MSTQPIPTLKETFSDGKEPNGQDFGNLIDSFEHKSIPIAQSRILGLNNELNKLEQEKASKEDLKNATTNDKGVFSTDVALKSAYPQIDNKKDFYAFVGSQNPFRKWAVQVDGGQWVDTGQDIDIADIDLAEYAKKIEVEKKADETNTAGTVVRSGEAESGNAHRADFCDENENIGFFIDGEGKFKAISDFSESFTVNDGFNNTYFCDENDNIGYYITGSGQFVGGLNMLVANDLGTSKEKPISQDFFTKKYYELLYKIDGSVQFDVVHIIVLGQSLSMGYAASPVCANLATEKALMFKHVRTQDFGYIFNISKAEYAANTDQYDNDFYGSFRQLVESGGYGGGTKWESASNNEWETPSAGIAEGLYNAYMQNEGIDIPFKVLLTAAGIGGTAINEYASGGRIYERCMKDVQKAKSLCDSLGLRYKVGFVTWMQGENNYGTATDSYKSSLKSLIEAYNAAIKNITGQDDDVPFVSYQTAVNKNSYYGTKTQYPALAQFQLSNEFDLMKIAYPIYNLQPAGDKVHLTNVSSRLLGNSLGRSLYDLMKDQYSVFKPTLVSKNGNQVVLLFDRDIVLDSDTLVANGYDISEINTNAGFFAKDAGGNNITTSVSVGSDNRSIVIVCSADPVSVNYGFNLANSYTTGGFVREKEQLSAYQSSKLSLYMPVQTINI